MSLKVDADCSTTVEEVRSDKSELNWVALKYEGKAKLMVGGKGSGGCVFVCILARAHTFIRPTSPLP